MERKAYIEEVSKRLGISKEGAYKDLLIPGMNGCHGKGESVGKCVELMKPWADSYLADKAAGRLKPWP